MTFTPINSQGGYLPVEFDVGMDSDDFQEFIAKRERLTASIVNVKVNGQYELQELQSARQWYGVASATQSNIKRYGYRTVVDLVALNGAAIGAGVTTLTLTNSSVPRSISNYKIPLPSGGSATATDGISIFLNDPQVYVRFNGSTNTLTITNNYGANLSQCYFVLEYLKG